MPEEPVRDLHSEEEPPPWLPSWNAWYGIVLLNLVVLIILFEIFRKVFD